jgi:hypothetical protein
MRHECETPCLFNLTARARFSSPNEICVDSTEEGIRAGDALARGDLGSRPTEEFDEDSVFDENEEILAWERLDFDNEERTEFDVD